MRIIIRYMCKSVLYSFSMRNISKTVKCLLRSAVGGSVKTVIFLFQVNKTINKCSFT